MARIGGDFSQEDLLRALVPESQLRFASAEEVPKHLVVMLGGPALLDQVPLPGHPGIEIRVRVFPPPYLTALPIAAKHEVGVAVAVNVINRPARLHRQTTRVDHITLPPSWPAPVPHQRGRGLAATNHKVISAVLVQVGYQRAGLLCRSPR